MKKNIKYILVAVIIGILLGKYTFNQYKDDTASTMKINNTIYLMQIGVYKSETNMKEACKNLKNYFFFSDESGYHVIIGITKNKKNKQKIVDSYELSANIYMKRANIDNIEFNTLLDQYDKLIDQTKDKETIVNSQKQILSKYEELIINNEQ